ncbi:hypothetical protein [Desulfoferrobacter suflitae]|uniref:hypothetical protein n=1 Tax=Desulfoferrobacter suflitae TaxID=2865782 RepID=UPI0021642430|nr:hypothetical protein [Desulfoferrobacter suflitae]MCK8602327.1 hypothetical protein [Desulfoferrobacter suflitae]
MLLNRLFRRKQKVVEEESRETDINQGIYYLYMIIILQVFFVLALVGIIMAIGKVLATPMWVFLAALMMGIGGCVYIYRKARRQFQRLREAISKVDLSDRNYEISFMGGVLTMRVEQNPRRLLEAPPAAPIMDAETLESQPTR